MNAPTIFSGYVLESRESEQASKMSYDDMTEVGEIRLHNSEKPERGDDLTDSPFNCNGQIYSGELVTLRKGD